MPKSLSQVYVHIIFSTKNRFPFIDDSVKQELWSYIGGICKLLECTPLHIGGYNDHIHVCCLLSKKITQIKLLEIIKKESSKWIKTKGKQYSNFYWQRGYGIFSVTPSEIEKVIKYIKKQHEHHRNNTFQEELLELLKKYNTDYDERYLWD